MCGGIPSIAACTVFHQRPTSGLNVSTLISIAERLSVCPNVLFAYSYFAYSYLAYSTALVSRTTVILI